MNNKMLKILGASKQGSKEWFEIINQSISLNPNNAYLYREKSVWFTKTGDYISAYALLDKAVQLNPRITLGYRGWLKLYKLHDYIGAIQDLKRMNLEFGKNYAWGENVFLLLSIAYTELRLFDKAIANVKKSIEIDGKNNKLSDYHFVKLGTCYKAKGYREKAFEMFQRAINTNPMCIEAYYYLAQLTERKVDAKKFINKAINLLEYGCCRSNSYKDYPDQIYREEIYSLRSSLESSNT